MYSPDGYALFVASEQGWYLWSVYGHLLATSSTLDQSQLSAVPLANGARSYEGYMDGVLDCCWGGSSLSVILLGHDSRLLYSLPLARSAVTSCYNPVSPRSSYILTIQDTIAQPLLQTEDGLLMYRGIRQKALDIINPEAPSYARLTMPSEYLQDYSPIRSVSISSDTRYLSAAGKVGFAHLSTNSGRWRILETFEDTSDGAANPEDIPIVRGGMCWYGNVLLVGADFGDSHQVTLRIAQRD